ncbi:MAG: pyridoxal-phosphate dependent enzyme [Thermoanaerobaculia bacterium]
MSPSTVRAPSIEQIRGAADRLAGTALRTPLVPLAVDDLPAPVWLKLENLQPIGSFKLRGAGNAMGLADGGTLRRGVVTTSAGNMAQGVAWCARRLGVPCRVLVPDHAPRTKLDAIRRMGGETISVPFDEWWRRLIEHDPGDLPGLFVHPVADTAVMAGNGTIGLEIAEELPEVRTVLVPYGGGGLSCGIASALAAVAPRARVFAVEVSSAAPLAASLSAGGPVTIDYRPSFVDGIGGRSVLEEMWPLASTLLAGSTVVDPAAVAQAVRLLVERQRVVAEGAGAAPVAAALAGAAGVGPTVCVVSGGNIDAARLASNLVEENP